MTELTTQISDTLDRYQAWSERRAALSVQEGTYGGHVDANEWHTSDDEAAELAHCLAHLLADTHPGVSREEVEAEAS